MLWSDVLELEEGEGQTASNWRWRYDGNFKSASTGLLPHQQRYHTALYSRLPHRIALFLCLRIRLDETHSFWSTPSNDRHRAHAYGTHACIFRVLRVSLQALSRPSWPTRASTRPTVICTLSWWCSPRPYRLSRRQSSGLGKTRYEGEYATLMIRTLLCREEL